MKPIRIFRKSLSTINLVKNLPGLITKIGKPPGTLVYTGTESNPTKISLIQYNESSATQTSIVDPKELFDKIDKNRVNWIHISGFENTGVIEAIGEHFEIHPLTMEDTLNVEHQPKIEEHEGYLYITLKILDYQKDAEIIENIHFSIIRVGNTIISLQEKDKDLFDPVIERIIYNNGPIRSKPASYLNYRLIDIVVDHYYHIIYNFSNWLSNLETALLESPRKEQIHDILHYKKQLLVLRKSIDPWKQIYRSVLGLGIGSWPEKEKVFLNDVFDHINQIIAHLDVFDENLRSLTDLYMSIVSNKMNEVMKTLTIIATIFIPLTFIAGIYGMNFANMPELQSPNGYYYVLAGMGGLGIIMYVYMRTKHWF